MEANHLNSAAWHLLNSWGWWYWWLPFFLSIVMAFLLMTLDGPFTNLGRYIRVLTWFAMVPMWFSPWFNVLGAIAQPLIMLAFCSVVGQMAWDCHKKRRVRKALRNPPASTAEKIVNTLVMQ
jgi:hypothetical protein